MATAAVIESATSAAEPRYHNSWPRNIVATLYNGVFTEAYNINVTVASAEGFAPVTSTRQVVSRLPPQEASVVSFGFNATGPLAGNVTVHVEYVDAYGRRYSDEVVIPVAVYAHQPEQPR